MSRLALAAAFLLPLTVLAGPAAGRMFAVGGILLALLVLAVRPRPVSPPGPWSAAALGAWILFGILRVALTPETTLGKDAIRVPPLELERSEAVADAGVTRHAGTAFGRGLADAALPLLLWGLVGLPRRERRRIPAALCAGILLALLLSLGGEETVPDPETSSSGPVLALWKDFPVLGTGPGQAATFAGAYGPAGVPGGILRWAAEYGAMGLLLLLAALVESAWRILYPAPEDARESPSPSRIRLAICTGLAAALAAGSAWTEGSLSRARAAAAGYREQGITVEALRERAATALDRAERVPAFPVAPIEKLEIRASALARLERHREAAEAFGRLLERRPFDRKYALGRADAYERIPDYPLAPRAYRALAALDPVRAGIWEEKARRLDAIQGGRIRAVTEGGQDDPILQESIVIEQLQRAGFGEEAMRRADRLRREHPDRPTGWKIHGWVLAVQGKPEEALPSFRRATELAPDDAETWSNRARALLSLERHDEADAAFTEVIRIDPRNAAAWSGRGRCAEARGDPDEARHLYERATEADPAAAEPHRLLADLALRQERYDEAREEYGKMLELAPGAVEAHLGLARIAEWSGDGTEARRQYVLLLRHHPPPPLAAEAHYRLAVLAARAGDLDAAERHYLAVLAIDPRHLDTHIDLARLYQERGDPGASARHYRVARTLGWNPENGDE